MAAAYASGGYTFKEKRQTLLAHILQYGQPDGEKQRRILEKWGVITRPALFFSGIKGVCSMERPQYSLEVGTALILGGGRRTPKSKNVLNCYSVSFRILPSGQAKGLD